MKAKKVLTLILTFVLAVGNVAYASGLNVVTHMGNGWNDDDTIRAVKQMNSEWIRDEIRWQHVETTKGNFKIPSSASWVNKAVNNGMKPLCILDYGNGIYRENNDEYTNIHLPTLGTKTGTEATKETTYWNAWMDYVELVATTYKGKIKAYEVWNEPNHSNFNNNVNAENYAKLYLATRNLIHSIDPDAIVLCGSIAGADNDFIGDVLKYIKNNGGISQIDAFSLHFYNPGSIPEDEYLSNLNRTYLMSFMLNGYNGPIWMTENGAYTGTAENSVNERVQASYAIRLPVIFDSFLDSKNRTGENFWYNLRNNGTDVSDSEHNYGLADNSYSPKLAYNAAALYNKLIDGMNFESLSSTSDKYVAQYSDGKGNYTYIAWTTKTTAQTVSVNIKGEVTTVYSMDGTVTEQFEQIGNKSFTVTSEPILIQSVNGLPKFTDSTSITYDAETKRISVTGGIEYFESEHEISFLVVPNGTKLSNGLNPALIGYIGSIKTNSPNFTHSFRLPDWYCGTADVYVAGLGMDNTVSANAPVADNKYMYVASIDVDKSSMIASAVVRNFTSSEKEANIIVAGYFEDELIDVRIETLKVPPKTYQQTEFKTVSFTPKAPVDKVVAYIWNEMGEIVPLITPVAK